MELTRGIKDYLDDLINDDSIFLVLIYGSNVTGHSTNSSDLDIFVLGIFKSSCCKVIEIDGTELEINFKDINSIENSIAKSIEDNNSYYESVLNNNIVLKDNNLLVDKYKNYIKMIKSYTKKQNRKMPMRNKYLLCEFYKGVRKDLDLYNYFNFLDQIRMTLAYMYNYSSLNIGKVYDMYNNLDRAIKDYCLDMPSNEFIRHYDLAIRNPLCEDEIKWLMQSINFEPSLILRDYGFFKYCDNQRTKSILIHMDKMVNKTIKFIIENNPYQDYVYYVVINHLYRFYEEIYGCVTEEFERVFNSAKLESDKFLKIEFLKHLFFLLEGKYAFDYKNYTLYFN